MKKCKWKLGLALCLAGALAFSNALAAPVTSYALTTVEWDEDNPKVPSKIHMPPYNYVSINKQLGTNELNDRALVKIGQMEIPKWACLAYDIFHWGSGRKSDDDKGNEHSGVTMNVAGDGALSNWDEAFHNKSPKYDSQIYLYERLMQTDQEVKGDSSSDYMKVTGVRSGAKSLNDVRYAMAREIDAALGSDQNPEYFLKWGGGGVVEGKDAALPALASTKDSKIVYNMVTTVNHRGLQDWYNSYGIAMYDFELSAIIDSQVPYKDAEEVQEDDTVNKDYTANSYSENNTKEESSIDMTLSDSTTQTITNSISKTESYSFTETIGSETTIKQIFGLTDVNEMIKIEVSAEQAIQTSWDTTTGCEETIENEVTASSVLPAHSALEMEQYTSNRVGTIKYTTPVAIRYKIAFFSMSGYVYDDEIPDAATTCNFSVMFGSGDSEGGYGAPENLRVRIAQDEDGDYTNDYELAYGQVYGFYDHNDTTSTADVTFIDWNEIFDLHDEDIDNAEELSTTIPFMSEGASMKVKTQTKTTTIKSIRPLYDLKTIKVDEGENQYNMIIGDVLNLDNIVVGGYDYDDVPYYGFRPDRGYWILCDENGDEITSSNVAEIINDPATGRSDIKAKAFGTVYMKWVLDDTIEYKSVNGTTGGNAENPVIVSATQNTPEYPIVQIKVNRPPADLTTYKLPVEVGPFEIPVDEELNLQNALKPAVIDGDDVIVTHIVKFAANDHEDSRLNIDSNGEFEGEIFKASEPGTYLVYAFYRDNGNELRSDKATIVVRPKRALDHLEVTNPENGPKITNTNLSCAYDLNSYVKYVDNYGDEWTDENTKPALSFKLPDEVTDEEAEIDADGKLTVYKGGTYEVTVSAQGLEDKVITVFVNALGELAISDDADPAVLETFIFNDPYSEKADVNKVDFSGLTVTGKDLKGNEWDVENDSDITWVVDDVDLADSEFEATSDGTFAIKAKSGDVESNELELEVKEERKLDKLELSGDIEDDEVGLGIGDGYTIDLSWAGLQNSTDVVVKGIDQYDHEYDLSNTALKWTADEHYAQIKNDTTLFGKVKGTGTLYVSTDDDSIQSNTIDFNVWLKPYVKEIYADKGGTYREDDVIDLSTINVSAKDQEGEVYNLSDEEKASIEWTLTDKGSIKASKSTHIDFDQQAKTLTITEGEISYGKTGSITLAASFVNPNGIKVEGNTTINIMQKPILHELKLALKDQDNAVLPTEVTYYASDLFDYEGIDQYSDPYDLTNEVLTFKSSNADYVVDEADDKDNCTILTGPSGSSTDITVSNINYINKDIVSNKVTISTPEVRRMKTLEFTYVPEALKFGENLDLLSLGAKCFDEKHKAFTEKEIEDYPSYITYSFDKGETNSDIDTAKNIVTAGDNKRAYITVSAFAVNGTTDKELTDADGNIIQTSDKVWVGPMIKEIKASETLFHVKGGKVTITFNGLALENGIEVKLLDKDGKEVQTATSTGTEKAQTVEFTLADNNSLTDPAEYTITYTVCGDPEGSDEFAPKSDIKLVVENHKLRKIERKEATCEEDGNIEYWICDTCKKLFKDEKATEEIKLEDTVLKAPGHVWDEGVITKEATVDEEGEKTFTCQTCKETRIEAVPKLKQTSGTMLCMLKAKGKTSLELTWSEIKGADGYDVFFGRCNHNGKSSSAELVGTVEPGQKLKYTAKGLKKGKEYKAYVQAFIYGNEKKIYVTDCELVHAYTGNYTKGYTNPKSISVNKSKVKIKVGKTFKIKAKVNKVKKGKKLMPAGHAPSLRYVSTDPSIAKVSKKGKITAVSKGKCTIYVYGVNGVRKAVKVTVK
ncbi:MAG: Ig-like domain-containing protein [Eubacterium sp.]|nr:Ig-like domain-containing protein [Eubacterium sp.]